MIAFCGLSLVFRPPAFLILNACPFFFLEGFPLLLSKPGIKHGSLVHLSSQLQSRMQKLCQKSETDFPPFFF